MSRPFTLPNRLSGKTNPHLSLAKSLRGRSRHAFLILLAAVQHVDIRMRGALSQGHEHTIHSDLVSIVMHIVVLLFVQERGLAQPPDSASTLCELHRTLMAARQFAKLDTRHDAWPQIVAVCVHLYEGIAGTSSADRPDIRLDSNSVAYLGPALSDDVIGCVLNALLERNGDDLNFATVDLEHIGTFYEGLLAFDSVEQRLWDEIYAPLQVRNDAHDERRRLGAHYTSPALTCVVVHRALAPLFERVWTSTALLELRICDPALGSGAFLLEVCRQMAVALVHAWERNGDTRNVCLGHDPNFEARRLVAERCLYGVDKNSRAVELARWTLWLATSSVDSPGVWLDAHLRCGDSLVGRPGGEVWFSGGPLGRFERHATALRKRQCPFHWDVEFAAVIERGGFDAFVGNPPWVSYAGRAAQPLPEDLRAYYAKTNPAFAGYRNLQGLFVARCAAMLKPLGRLGFVLPSSMSELDGYAPTRRAHEAFCACDEELPDFGNAFDDVFQPSMALLSTRRAEPVSTDKPPVWPVVRRDLDTGAKSLFSRLSALPTLPPELFGERGFQSLKDDARHIVAMDVPMAAHHVALRVGSDIEPFARGPARWHCDPSALGARFRTAAQWLDVALLIRQTARFPIAALADGQAFRNSILAGFSSATWSQYFLLAWLNSSPIRWFHYVRNRDARQGMPQVKMAHLRALPAPTSFAFVEPIEAFGRILGERNAGIELSEQVILDALVADALELRVEERALVRTWADVHVVK